MTGAFEPQFIGRSNELNILLENIQNKKNTIIEGEEGVGKSTILDKIYQILQSDYSDKCVVGYYNNGKALIGRTISEASIFIVLLEDLLEWLKQKFFLNESLVFDKDKLKNSLINFGKKRSTKIAKILARDVLNKLGLSSIEEIAKEFGKEYNQEKAVFDMSEDFIDSIKSEALIFNSKEILKTFTNFFNDKKFIFIIDKFESLNEKTIELFLNLMKLTDFHFIVSITKYKNYGNSSDRKKYENIIKECNSNLTVQWISIKGLSQENIKEWIKIVHNRRLLDNDIKSIWDKTNGLPVLLEPWINLSNLDITEIDVKQLCCSIILQYSDLDANMIIKIHKLSILKYPFEINNLINYLNLGNNEQYSIILYDLIKFGIFDKSKEWFRNEVIQNCFRNDIPNQQRILLHKEAKNYYETIVKEDVNITKKRH